MSDRVTNVEIEDVLSSIRRLLSETAPAPRDTASCPPVQSTPEGTMNWGGGPRLSTDVAPLPPVGKLLLTEADRVAPPVPAARDFLVESGIIPDLPFAFRGREDPPLAADDAAPKPDDTIATDDAGGAGTTADAMPSAKIAADLTGLGEQDRPAADAGRDDMPAARGNDLPDGIDLRSIDPQQRLSETVAGLERATQRTVEEWEPDGSEGVPVMDWAAAAEQTEEGPVPIFRSRKPPPLRLSPELAVAPELAKPAEPSAMRSAAVLPFQPDRFPGYATDAPAGLDRDLAGEPAGRDAQDDAAADDFASDVALMAALRDANGLNEAFLRELVLEIVRQELQGALGERITRNVRKLVRREIYRVLNEAEQD